MIITLNSILMKYDIFEYIPEQIYFVNFSTLYRYYKKVIV